MIRLVASDLDGTILKNGAQTLPDGFIEKIRELKKAGIHFAAASGRQYPNIRRMFAPLGDEISYICENGAITFYQGRRLYEDLFPDDLLRDIIQEALKKEGTEITCSMWDVQYLLPKNQAFVHFLKETVGYDCKVVSSIEEVPHSCIKAAVYEENRDMEENLYYWQRRFGDRCKVVTSGNRWIDFVPFHTNKGNGVKALLKEMHLSPDECMVFGDEYNDLEMLQCVAHSVAMSCAKEGVKKEAAYLTDSVDQVLDRLIKNGGSVKDLFL